MLPTDPKARKAIPIFSGFMKYFPKAIAAVAQLSAIANEQHNPGTPVHWDKSKSQDELDALARHLDEIAAEVVYDDDRVLMATKVAWRGVANLERLLDSGVAPIQPEGVDRYGKPIIEPGTIVLHTCDNHSRPFDARWRSTLCAACSLMKVRC